MKEVKSQIIILFLVLLLLIILNLDTDNKTANDFSLNLISEIIGIIFTVLLIDFSVKKRENKEKKNILKNTYIQYKRPAGNLLHFFATAYKSSTLSKPYEWDTDYKKLLSTEQFYNSIEYLDFLKPAPVTPQTDWVNYSASKMTMIKNDFEKIIDKYAFILDSKIISDLEWICNNSIINTLSSGPIIMASDQSLGYKREDLCLLSIESENNKNPVKELIDKIFEITDYFQSISDEKSDLNYSKAIWQENMSPKLSESRVNIK